VKAAIDLGREALLEVARRFHALPWNDARGDADDDDRRTDRDLVSRRQHARTRQQLAVDPGSVAAPCVRDLDLEPMASKDRVNP
jgi:hypothetical protein